MSIFEAHEKKSATTFVVSFPSLIAVSVLGKLRLLLACAAIAGVVISFRIVCVFHCCKLVGVQGESEGCTRETAQEEVKGRRLSMLETRQRACTTT